MRCRLPPCWQDWWVVADGGVGGERRCRRSVRHSSKVFVLTRAAAAGGDQKKMKNVCRVDGAKVATNIVLFSIIHTTQSTGSGGFKKFKV